MPSGILSVKKFNKNKKKNEEKKKKKDSEWHSRPYVFENKFLTGFSHVNLSGVGCPDLGSILLMPTHGELELDPEQYGTTFTNQKSVPGEYSCTLEKYNIAVNVTADIRSGFSRYTFPRGQANIILNLGLGLTNETGASLKVLSDHEVEGFKMTGDFCYTPEAVRPVYFYLKINKSADKYGAWKKMPHFKGVEGEWSKYNDAYKPYDAYKGDLAGENLGAYFSYDLREGEQIEVIVGISYVSAENARMNLEKELGNKNFEQVKAHNQNEWEKKLSRIKVEGGSKDDKTIFYTALYHLLMHPNILQDVNGDYPSMQGFEVLNTGNQNRYTVFSLWDTYRNVHTFL